MDFKYLDIELMEKLCHRFAVAVFDTKDDPIASFRDHDIALLEASLNLTRATFGGKDLYPALVDKAAVLYYALNKNHPFRNGNKRIATATLLVFLFINDHWLDAGKDEMTRLTLDVAKSEANRRDEVLVKIKAWIASHLVAAEVGKRSEGGH